MRNACSPSIVDPVSSVTWISTLSAMSLCVNCSVNHPYCLTFAPPYALRLTLDSVERLVVHGCLSVLETGVCIHGVASHSPLLRCQSGIPQECLSFVLSSVCLRMLEICLFSCIWTQFWQSVQFRLNRAQSVRLCHCYPCHKQYVLFFYHGKYVCFSICSGVVVIDVLLRCLTFSSDIHKPNVL